MASFKVDMGGAKDKIRAICSNPKVGSTAASEVERLAKPYVPFAEGSLRGSAVVSPFLVTYTTPYAHYQWAGERMDGTHVIRRRTTPNTVSHWEKFVNKDELARNLTDYLKGL